MELTNLLFLFIIGIISGIINVMAGGGSLLTLPFLIFMGFDGSVANGTNRIAIFMQSFFSVLSFRNENHSYFKESFKISLLTLPGAIFGAFFAVKITNDSFNVVLALVMAFVLLQMFLPNSKKNDGLNSNSILSSIAMFFIGFYGGFIQAGVGFLLMATIKYFYTNDLLKVNVHKVFATFIFTIPALIIFIISGNVNWIAGIILSLGSSLGAFIAVKLSIKKGEKLIKAFLVPSVLFMIAKLLNII